MIKILLGTTPEATTSALALGVLFIMCGAFLMVLVNKRRSRLEINNDLELGKLKEHNAYKLAIEQDANRTRIEQRKIDANVAIEKERIQQNLITSHASRTAGAADVEQPNQQ